MVFGTFDGLHPGHLNFFKQTRQIFFNVFLIVSVARDRNVLRIKKRLPALREKKRLAIIKKSRLADKVVLGGIRNHLSHILKEKPDAIALGYDQKEYIKGLKKSLEDKGLSIKIMRLKPYRENIYKNHLLKQKRKI